MTLHFAADFNSESDLQSFLQTVRNWEQDHKHVQMAMFVDASDKPDRTAEDIMASITPPFAFTQKIPRC